MSQAFDRSMILGDFENADLIMGDKPLTLYKNNEKVDEWGIDNHSIPVAGLFPEISASNTLKMGDYLIPALSQGTDVKIGDNLELRLGERTLLVVPIK